MGTVLWLILVIIGGAIIGLIAKAILPGRQNIPMWLTIVAGIVGVLVGTAIASAVFGFNTQGVFNIGEIIIQIIVGVAAVAAAAALYPRLSGARR